MFKTKLDDVDYFDRLESLLYLLTRMVEETYDNPEKKDRREQRRLEQKNRYSV